MRRFCCATVLLILFANSLNIYAESSGDGSDSLVLWHRYNEQYKVEDILDESGNGNIGEFNTADKFTVSNSEDKNMALRMYGDINKNGSLGYMIMPTDNLSLKQGAISFWLFIDPDISVKRGIILASGGGDGKKKYISCKNKNGKTELVVSFGKNISVKSIPVNQWVHIAWVFNIKSQSIYINGKMKTTEKSGASMDSSQGLYVGHDGSKWNKNHSGKHGFAGAIDELQIFNKPVTVFSGMSDENKPSADSPNLGMVIHYDFDSDSAINNGNSSLNGKDMNIKEKSVKGLTKWKKGDKAWQFIEKHSELGSVIEIPESDLLNISNGAIIIKFKIDKYSRQSYEQYYLFTIYRNAGSSLKSRFLLRINNISEGEEYNPDKVTGLNMIIDYKSETDSIVKPDFKFKPNEWITLTYAWHTEDDASANYVDLWINGKSYGHFTGTRYKLTGEAPMKIGAFTNRNNWSYGINMTISDFKIYNYIPTGIGSNK